MNRRRPNGKGGYNNAPNPDGPVDLSVPVLRVATANAEEAAFIFGYSCHCTTLGLQKFSGDYAGYAQQYLQEAHPGVISMFMNGCSGDQNPYPRNTRELAQAHGRSLATAVEAALTTQLKPLSGKIRAAYREIPLASVSFPTREQLEAQTQVGHQAGRGSRHSGPESSERNRDTTDRLPVPCAGHATWRSAHLGHVGRRGGGRLRVATETGDQGSDRLGSPATRTTS